MSHNRQLDELLTEVKKIARTANEEKDFKPAFALLRDFRETVGPISYDNSAKWWACAAIALLGGGFALAYFLHPALQETLDVWGYAIMGAFVVAIIVMFIVIGLSDSAIGEVSDLIFEKDVFYDNRLQKQDIDGQETELYRQFKKEFGDFRGRGDEDRYVSQMVRGEWTGKEYSFPYDHYTFHYVRVYYVTVTHTDGKKTWTTVERRTETLYRYGLILDFPFAKGIAVCSGGGDYDYPESFQPTSEDFNKTFGVGTVKAIEAAKFLKPAVVLAFVELDRYFSGLNVEVNRNGRLNIAFSDSDVLDLGRKYSIAQPDEFEEEIRSHLELPKLRLLLQFAETLKKHNDSNF